MIELILGIVTALVVDTIWWRINFKKIEKGLEAHEHYHIGLELLILYMLTDFTLFAGMGLGFIISEWSQHIEVKGDKVVKGHPFAIGSTHLKQSTIIGAALSAVLAALIILI